MLSKFSLRIKILIENLVKRINFHCLESSHFFSKSKDMGEKYFKVFSKSYKQKSKLAKTAISPRSSLIATGLSEEKRLFSQAKTKSVSLNF